MARASKYQGKRDEIILQLGQAAARHSKPPTVRVLADELGVGVATMHDYLKKLGSEGVVEWTPGRHRSLKLTPAGLQELSSLAARSA